MVGYSSFQYQQASNIQILIINILVELVTMLNDKNRKSFILVVYYDSILSKKRFTKLGITF